MAAPVHRSPIGEIFLHYGTLFGRIAATMKKLLSEKFFNKFQQKTLSPKKRPPHSENRKYITEIGWIKMRSQHFQAIRGSGKCQQRLVNQLAYDYEENIC